MFSPLDPIRISSLSGLPSSRSFAPFNFQLDEAALLFSSCEKLYVCSASRDYAWLKGCIKAGTFSQYPTQVRATSRLQRALRFSLPRTARLGVPPLPARPKLLSRTHDCANPTIVMPHDIRQRSCQHNYLWVILGLVSFK